MKTHQRFRFHVLGIVCAVLCAGVSSTPIQLQLGPPPEAFFPEVRAFLEQLAAVYNASQDEAIVVVAADDPDFLERPVTQEALGDIVLVTGARYGERSTLAEYAAAGFLAPLDPFVNAPEFNRQDYLGSVWNMVTIEGQTFGVPLLARAWGIGVNTDYCDVQQLSLHLDGWNDLLAFMESAELDLNADGVPETLMSHTTRDPVFVWQILFLHYGGDPNDPASFCAQSSAWQQATAQTQSLLERHPDLFAGPGDTRRRLEMYPQPVQFVHNDGMDPGALPLLKRASPQWLVLPPPGAEALPNLDATVAAITVSEPARVEAAWRFVAWLSSPEVMASIYPMANLVPLRRSVADATGNEAMRVFVATLDRVAFQRPMVEESPDMATLKAMLRSLSHE